MSQFADEIQSEMLAEKDDEITRLRADLAAVSAERDRVREALKAEKVLTNACERVNRRNDELIAEARMLREALKPFAKLKPVSWSLENDHYFIDTDDIRRARAALEGVTEPANTQTGER